MATAQTASIDGNGVRSLLGVANEAGTAPLRLYASPSTHSLKVQDGTGGSDYGTANANRDANNQPTLMAVSSVDGVTPVEVYVDKITHEVLIQST